MPRSHPAGPRPGRPTDTDLDPTPGTIPLAVVPVGATGSDQPTRLMLVDTRSATKRAQVLAEDARVNLPEQTLVQIAQSCVSLEEMTRSQLRRQRSETGWLWLLELRQFVTMLNLTPSNDRLGDRLLFAADPDFATDGRPSGNVAVPMPHSEGTYAQIVYDAPRATLMQATDANCRNVLALNPQPDIGSDIIHRALTTVPTLLDFEGEDSQDEQVTVDGNSRLASAFSRLPIDPDWLPERLRAIYKPEPKSEWVDLTPSLLMNLTFTERRDLTRRMLKWAAARLAQPATTTAADLRERNEAAAALNAITAPVQVIVGYEDDEPATFGMERFASAVRSYLERMNVGVKEFDVGARNAIRAEQIVTAAHALGHFTDSDLDLLIGRGDVTGAMTERRLAPRHRDLRAAEVLRLCTTRSPVLNHVIREKNRKPSASVSLRSQMASELALRSYTTALGGEDGALERARAALTSGSGCVWQDLVTGTWKVENVSTPAKVDALAARARAELDFNRAGKARGSVGPAARLLGVLGMFALVTRGGLTSPKGSTTVIVGGEPIDRAPVGLIVEKLLTLKWGIDLLAENVKRARAGQHLVHVKVNEAKTKVEVIDDPTASVSLRDGRLRQAVRFATEGTADSTGVNDEENAFTEMAEAITNAFEKFKDYRTLRNEDPSPEPLPKVKTEPSIKQLDTMRKALEHMSVLELDDEV